MIPPFAANYIILPASDGILVPYPSITVVNITVYNPTVPPDDLLFYLENPSGILVAAVNKYTPTGTWLIGIYCITPLYIKNVAGWAATIGVAS